MCVQQFLQSSSSGKKTCIVCASTCLYRENDILIITFHINAICWIKTVLSSMLLLCIIWCHQSCQQNRDNSNRSDKIRTRKCKSAMGGRMRSSHGWVGSSDTGVLLLSCSVATCQQMTGRCHSLSLAFLVSKWNPQIVNRFISSGGCFANYHGVTSISRTSAH